VTFLYVLVAAAVLAGASLGGRALVPMLFGGFRMTRGERQFLRVFGTVMGFIFGAAVLVVLALFAVGAHLLESGAGA
jgi:hypothetical protein